MVAQEVLEHKTFGVEGGKVILAYFGLVFRSRLQEDVHGELGAGTA